MPLSQALAFDRLVLTGGAKVPVYPPRPAWEVSILNPTSGDLQVHDRDDDDLHYVTIAAGYERPFPVQKHIFNRREVAFWLKPSVDGTYTIIWY